MPMFIIQVRAIATCCYDVAVEATDEKAAISIACTPSSYRHYSPADFQVDPDICEFDPIETEQVTATCPECGREHLYPSRTIIRCDGPASGSDYVLVGGVCIQAAWWHADADYCAECGEKIEARENSYLDSQGLEC